MALAGQTPQIISNQYIERIINNADPDQMYSFSVKAAGHSFYVLSLKNIGYTLVYDMAQKGWTYWTSTENNVEGYFKLIYYTKFQNYNILQHETNGKSYILSQNYYNDYGNPIQVLCRTPLVDFGNNDRKFFVGAQVVGDKVDSYALLRYTNDDYQNYSNWVNINLSTQKAQANRLGQGRRRSFDLLHADNVPLRLQYLEIDFEQGES
jgi:hypothetical protein